MRLSYCGDFDIPFTHCSVIHIRAMFIVPKSLLVPTIFHFARLTISQ